METPLLDMVKARASAQFDTWIGALAAEQRRDSQLIQTHIVSLAVASVPNPADDDYADEPVQSLLRCAVEHTALAIDEPEDVEAHVVDYAARAAHLRPIMLIHSNLVNVVRRHLRMYWRQHPLNPFREDLG